MRALATSTCFNRMMLMFAFFHMMRQPTFTSLSFGMCWCIPLGVFVLCHTTIITPMLFASTSLTHVLRLCSHIAFQKPICEANSTGDCVSNRWLASSTVDRENHNASGMIPGTVMVYRANSLQGALDCQLPVCVYALGDSSSPLCV